MNKAIYCCVIFLVYCNFSFAQQDGGLFSKANADVTDVIVHDVFSPPVASRIYLYCGIAAYETTLRSSGNKKYVSLCKQLNGLESLPAPVGKVNAVIACVSAFYNTALHYVFSEAALRDSFERELAKFKTIRKNNPLLFKNSVDYGKLVADSIFQWSKSDNYAATRKKRRYSFLKQPGKWIPSPPAYMAAVEPYWGEMRTAVKGSEKAYAISSPEIFSIDSASKFYELAKEVYEAGNNMSPEQNAIAGFWDCNPFNVQTRGHLMFGIKKLSPGGHWINIALISAKKSKADLITETAAYALTAIAIYDAFIHCWTEKYTSNLIRPETYINNYIDARWHPLLQTPPFPEYPSGHSVVSLAAATILTDFFGDDFSFDDDTEVDYGLPVRSFTSFFDAANEAAISRLYGGIHYKEAIENGKLLGKRTAKYVLQNVKIKR